MRYSNHNYAVLRAMLWTSSLVKNHSSNHLHNVRKTFLHSHDKRIHSEAEWQVGHLQSQHSSGTCCQSSNHLHNARKTSPHAHNKRVHSVVEWQVSHFQSQLPAFKWNVLPSKIHKHACMEQYRQYLMMVRFAEQNTQACMHGTISTVSHDGMWVSKVGEVQGSFLSHIWIHKQCDPPSRQYSVKNGNIVSSIPPVTEANEVVS